MNFNDAITVYSLEEYDDILQNRMQQFKEELDNDIKSTTDVIKIKNFKKELKNITTLMFIKSNDYILYNNKRILASEYFQCINNCICKKN